VEFPWSRLLNLPNEDNAGDDDRNKPSYFKQVAAAEAGPALTTFGTAAAVTTADLTLSTGTATIPPVIATAAVSTVPTYKSNGGPLSYTVPAAAAIYPYRRRPHWIFLVLPLQLWMHRREATEAATNIHCNHRSNCPPLRPRPPPPPPLPPLWTPLVVVVTTRLARSRHPWEWAARWPHRERPMTRLLRYHRPLPLL
jgi:hypothetical protein